MVNPDSGTRANPAAAPLWKLGQAPGAGAASPAPAPLPRQRPHTHTRGTSTASVAGHGTVRKLAMPLSVKNRTIPSIIFYIILY